MKAKTYDQWIGKRVRLRRSTDGKVGTIVDSAGMNTWWLVEWCDGEKKRAAERHLEVITEDAYGAALAGR